MSDDEVRKAILSRREFVQLSAGVLVATGPSDSSGNPRLAFDLVDSTQVLPHERRGESHTTLSLDGKWSVIELPLSVEGEAGYGVYKQVTSKPLIAQVPGEIHLDLMRAGRMEDPDKSDNARTRCRWPEERSWWYRTGFVIPPNFRENFTQSLIFEGIDLYGQVFVNGKFIGSTKDSFSTIAFDVRGVIKEGDNELVVRVTSGMEFVPRPVSSEDFREFPWKITNRERSFTNVRRRFLRKPAYAAYGWDFCDALPNIGIWRPVRLEGRTKVVLHHLRLDTNIQGKAVALEGEVVVENLHPWSEYRCILELFLESPTGQITVQRNGFNLQAGRSSLSSRIPVRDPQLWWPNGMGEQPLYKLVARILCDGIETDRRSQSIGLRTIALDRSPLSEGSRFCFKVNGETVYCKGGGWSSPDLIPARIERERYQGLIAAAQNANFTMLRVNGCAFYEHDDFYDACDRAGILVWQDFPFTCALYPDRDPEFMAMVREEAESAVQRLRHHPSLALWCGNNECAIGMMAGDFGKVSVTVGQNIDGVRIYNQLLPDICRLLDPCRPYLPSSPIGGSEPGGEFSGDRHSPYGLVGLVGGHLEGSGGGVTDEVKLRRWQEFADTFHARFVSEYGAIGPPHMASVRDYLKVDEQSLDSVSWKIHTNAFEGAFSPVAAGIGSYYGDPTGLSMPEFIIYGQMYQAQLIGGFLEAMRFRKNDGQAECQGVLNWSFNDTWGEVGWSIIDHYLRRKASYYWFKRAATPVKVLVRSNNGHLTTRVVNDTLRSYSAEVLSGWMRLDGRAQELEKYSVIIPANGMTEIASVPLPGRIDRNPREWLYAATMRGDEFQQTQAIWTLAPYRDLQVPTPVIESEIRQGVLTVKSKTYCHGVHFPDEGADILADNYFDLLPGVTQRIGIVRSSPSGEFTLRAVMPIK